MHRAVVLMAGDAIGHLVVTGFSGDHSSHWIVDTNSLLDQTLAEPRLARAGAADQEGEHRPA